MNAKLTFYLLGKRNGFDMKSNLRLVQESQYWTPEQIEAYQMKHLRLLLEHAYHHVPFYKSVFDRQGLKPGDFQKTADLCRLKPIRKKEVIANPTAFIADNRSVFNGRKQLTGGSTGELLTYFQDSQAWAMNWALKMRTFEWAGFGYGRDRLGVMAGGSLVPQRSASFGKWLWRKVNNCHYMPITHLDDATMEECYGWLGKHGVRFLRGYPSALSTFASFLRDTKRLLPMRAVFTTAEVLYPYQRETIRQAFGCEVYDTYGCSDGMGHATECELHDGLHVCPEASILQVVDAEGNPVAPGEEGEVVLTSLYDYTMPLIRYAPGDRAVLKHGKCACGRDGMMLERISGRVTDVFRLPNGRLFNGLSIPFWNLASDFSRFQVVQASDDLVVVLIVPKKTVKKDVVENVKRLMQYHCGEGVNVRVDLVDHIEAPPSGKFQCVVSKVRH